MTTKQKATVMMLISVVLFSTDFLPKSAWYGCLYLLHKERKGFLFWNTSDTAIFAAAVTGRLSGIASCFLCHPSRPFGRRYHRQQNRSLFHNAVFCYLFKRKVDKNTNPCTAGDFYRWLASSES